MQPGASCRVLAPHRRGAGKGQKPLNAAPGAATFPRLSRTAAQERPRAAGGTRPAASRPGIQPVPSAAAGARASSRAPGGTRAPPPRRQLYFEPASGPQPSRSKLSLVCLASLTPHTFPRATLPLYPPTMGCGLPHLAAPCKHTHTQPRSNSGVETQKTSSLGSARLVQDAGSNQPVSTLRVPLPPLPPREGTVPPPARPTPFSQCDRIPAESPHPPFAFRLPKALFVSLSFSFLLSSAERGGKRREEFFPA